MNTKKVTLVTPAGASSKAVDLCFLLLFDGAIEGDGNQRHTAQDAVGRVENLLFVGENDSLIGQLLLKIADYLANESHQPSLQLDYMWTVARRRSRFVGVMALVLDCLHRKVQVQATAFDVRSGKDEEGIGRVGIAEETARWRELVLVSETQVDAAEGAQNTPQVVSQRLQLSIEEDVGDYREKRTAPTVRKNSHLLERGIGDGGLPLNGGLQLGWQQLQKGELWLGGVFLTRSRMAVAHVVWSRRRGDEETRRR